MTITELFFVFFTEFSLPIVPPERGTNGDLFFGFFFGSAVIGLPTAYQEQRSEPKSEIKKKQKKNGRRTSSASLRWRPTDRWSADTKINTEKIIIYSQKKEKRKRKRR